MTVSARGRIAPSPPPPFAATSGEPFVGVHSWNAPKSAIGKERPLTREQYAQGQAVLRKIHALPHFLSSIFLGRHSFLLKEQGCTLLISGLCSSLSAASGRALKSLMRKMR